jgi:hypothetical protein
MHAAATVLAGIGLAMGTSLVALDTNPALPLPEGTAASRLVWLQNKPCKDVHDDDKHKSATGNESQDIRFIIHSVKKWKNADLARGKWVGVVERTDNTTGASRIFPGLTAEKHGCLLFIVTQGNTAADTVSHAYLARQGENLPVVLRNSVICWHADVQDGKPEWKTAADECPEKSRIQFTFAIDSDQQATVSWTVSSGELEPDFRDAIRRNPKTERLPEPVIQKVLQQLRAPGPWFPCAETGCCRSWGE